jgi:hypothetical protein
MSEESARGFARRVLSLPEEVAVGFLERYHDKTCGCGQKEDGRMLLNAIREKWAGKL